MKYLIIILFLNSFSHIVYSQYYYLNLTEQEIRNRRSSDKTATEIHYDKYHQKILHWVDPFDSLEEMFIYFQRDTSALTVMVVSTPSRLIQQATSFTDRYSQLSANIWEANFKDAQLSITLVDYINPLTNKSRAAFFIHDKKLSLSSCHVQMSNEYFYSGIEKTKLKDYSGAIKDFTKEIEINPDNANAYENRGLSKAKLENYQGAISDYNKAIDLLPKDADFYYSRGNAKYNLQDYRGAIADFSIAIELNSNDAQCYNARGAAKYRLQDTQGAIKDYNVAIELNPKDADAYNNRGLSKIAVGQKDSGCLDLSKAGELGDRDAYEAIRKFCN